MSLEELYVRLHLPPLSHWLLILVIAIGHFLYCPQKRVVRYPRSSATSDTYRPSSRAYSSDSGRPTSASTSRCSAAGCPSGHKTDDPGKHTENRFLPTLSDHLQTRRSPLPLHLPIKLQSSLPPRIASDQS